MKVLLSLLFAISSHIAYAKSAAQIDPTPELKIQLSNQTKVQIENISLEPDFSCWTRVSTGSGETSSYAHQVAVPFSYSIRDLSSSLTSIYFKIEKTATAQSPKVSSIFNSTHCSFGVIFQFKLSDQPQEYRITKLLGELSSTAVHTNFTQDFIQNFSGTYVLKEVFGGETYCPELGRRCPYCTVSLFKETQDGLTRVGGSYNMRTCSKP